MVLSSSYMNSPQDVGKLLLDRNEVLRVLETQPSTKQEILPEVGVARSTLDRIMRQLETTGLVVYANGEWHLTIYGQCAFVLLQEYLERLEDLDKAAQLVGMAAEKTPLDCSLFIGADVHYPDGAIHDDVIQVFLNAVKAATRLRVFTPCVLFGHADTFYENATTGENPRVEVVVSRSLFDDLRVNHPECVDKAVTDSAISLFIGTMPASFGLWIADNDHVGVLLFGKNGVRGILVNDTDTALHWAEEKYDQIKQTADPVKNGPEAGDSVSIY